MTPTARERPQMYVADFEELSLRAPETVTLEFLYGKIGAKPVPDGDHSQIIMWLIRQCIQQRPDLNLFPEQGLKVETYRHGRVKPDGVLAPEEHFTGQGEYADPDGVLMTLEITSWDRDTDQRDRKEKPRAYAESGIPVYLLVDREQCTVTVFSQPENGRYSNTHIADFGNTVALPGLGISLATERLKNYVR
ncbi:Uma2 family endonuclease [Streptomyces olivoreticuli]|uniref:Uma2 family endonuclease n=1 Tax=Streptomyces olivoreticuli TaxID=68246 RepID=UPI000E257FA4|nr:Uma2 family endonuclease [Streptomyces olivoreticuli]